MVGLWWFRLECRREVLPTRLGRGCGEMYGMISWMILEVDHMSGEDRRDTVLFFVLLCMAGEMNLR